jgi:uncharacterized membrane protein
MRVITELIIIFAAFIGFTISLFIRHKKRASEKLVCYLGSDCNAVVHSEFAFFFGIPVEIIGMMYYGAIAIGHGFVLGFPMLFPTWFDLALLLASAAGFLFSCYLIFLQAFTIKQWCMWCIFSAGMCTTIFIAGVTGAAGTMLDLLRNSKEFIVIIHAFAMAIGLGTATITDVFFFKFLKNFKITEDEVETFRTLSQIIWAALALVIISGVALFLPASLTYIESTKFVAKLIVVLVIIANGAVLNLYVSPHLTRISFGQAHNHVPGELHTIRRIAFALGGISLASWYSAFILGSVRSLSFSVTEILLGYLAIVVGAVVMSQIMERTFSKRAFEF